MDIYYKIIFFSEWHCGSGLASGANLDALVIKDNDGLPFIPGKTIKGLLREAVEEIKNFRNAPVDPAVIFGKTDKDGFTSTGLAFFSNAELPEDVRQYILSAQTGQYMYRSTTSVTIDEVSGTAKDNHLRKIETVVPCILEGHISGLPDDKDKNGINQYRKIIADGMKYIKRLGLDRNRGLGRCEFSIKED